MKNFFVYFYEILKLFCVPLVKGVLLGGVPSLLFHGLMLFLYSRVHFLSGVSNSYDETTLGASELEALHRNRISAAMIGSCFYFIKVFGGQFVSGLTDAEEKLLGDQLVKQHLKVVAKRAQNNRTRRAKKTDNHLDSAANFEAVELEENLNPEFYKPHHFGFIELGSIYNMKARGFFWVQVSSLWLLVYFMHMKTTEFFNHNIFPAIPGQFVISLLHMGLSVTALDGEIMLATPIITTYGLVGFYVFLKPDTYENFLLSLIQIIIFSMMKIMYFVVVRAYLAAERFRQLGVAPPRNTGLYYYLLTREKVRRFFRQLGVKLEKDKPPPKQTKFDPKKMSMRDNSRELVLYFLMDSSCRCVANLLRVSTPSFNVFYPTLTKYDLPDSFDAQMHINCLVVSAIWIVLEIIFMYFAEGWFDYEVLNLLNFYRFRYQRRQHDWLFDKFILDESIDPGYRTLDYLGFSDQFFLVLSGLTVNLVVTAYMIFVAIEHKFNAFGDAAIILIVFFGYSVAFVAVTLVRWMVDMVSPWSRSSKPPGEQLSTQLKLEGYSLAEYDPYTEPFIVEDFIDQQRDWIIRNLERILKPEDFLRHEGFLIDLNSKVTANIKSLEIGSLKGEIIDRYRYVASLHSDDYSNYIVRTHPNQFYNLATLIHYWFSLGKEAVYFRRLIQGMGAEVQKGLCEDCHSDENLLVEERNSFYKILSYYRVHLKGGLPRHEDWRAFYRRHQVFVTLCKNCEKIRRIKRFKKTHQTLNSNYLKVAHQSDFSERILKDLIREDLQPTPKVLLLQWWLAARSRRLGGSRVDPGQSGGGGTRETPHDRIMKLLDEYESNC